MQEEGVLKPQMIARPIDGFPKTVIGCFHNRYIQVASKRFDLKKITTIFAGAPFPIYSFTYQGRTMGLYLSCEANMASAVFMEELISYGARNFVFFGSCGSLDSAITHNSLIIPSSAYCDEGVAKHYAHTDSWIDNPHLTELENIISDLELPYVKGKVWTTSSPYRELPSTIKTLKDQGTIAVEMECASLIAVANFRQVKVLQFLYSEDKLDGPVWNQGTLGRMGNDTSQKYLEIAIQIALSMKAI